MNKTEEEEGLVKEEVWDNIKKKISIKYTPNWSKVQEWLKSYKFSIITLLIKELLRGTTMFLFLMWSQIYFLVSY